MRLPRPPYCLEVQTSVLVNNNKVCCACELFLAFTAAVKYAERALSQPPPRLKQSCSQLRVVNLAMSAGTESQPARHRYLRYYAELLRMGGTLPQRRTLSLAALALSGLPAGATCRITVSLRSSSSDAAQTVSQPMALRVSLNEAVTRSPRAPSSTRELDLAVVCSRCDRPAQKLAAPRHDFACNGR